VPNPPWLAGVGPWTLADLARRPAARPRRARELSGAARAGHAAARALARGPRARAGARAGWAGGALPLARLRALAAARARDGRLPARGARPSRRAAQSVRGAARRPGLLSAVGRAGRRGARGGLHGDRRLARRPLLPGGRRATVRRAARAARAGGGRRRA